MEVKTISWNKTITAEIALNVDTIEYKDQQVFELPFTIPGGDGSNYHGEIKHRRSGRLACYVNDVKSLTGSISMMISKGSKRVRTWTQTDTSVLNTKMLRTVKNYDVKFLKGSFTIRFEPMDEKLVEEKLINSFSSLLKQDNLEGPNDVRLVFEEKEFEFNMSCLAIISPMFKDLFENCPGENKIPISNDVTTLQTMETFHKLLAKKSVLPQDITINLYLFADKYV